MPTPAPLLATPAARRRHRRRSRSQGGGWSERIVRRRERDEQEKPLCRALAAAGRSGLGFQEVDRRVGDDVCGPTQGLSCVAAFALAIAPAAVFETSTAASTLAVRPLRPCQVTLARFGVAQRHLAAVAARLA